MFKDYFSKIINPIFFITNDISRAIGLETIVPDYHIVCLDENPLIDYLIKNGHSVFCLEREIGKKNTILRNSGSIISHPLVVKYIKEKSKGKIPQILFFKPQKKIESICFKEKWTLLGNKTELNKIFEDKINFFKLAVKNSWPIVESESQILGQTDFKYIEKKYGLPFVIQFGRGWAGSSTFFINSQNEFDKIKKEKESAEIKISKFIKGTTIINNATIFNNKTYFSKPAVQIKPDIELTGYCGGTGGRNWPAEIEKNVEKKIEEITLLVGKKMSESGYKGYFGLDFLLEDNSNNLYLSECNARLTASSSFYTQNEIYNNVFPLLGYHIFSFIENIIDLPEYPVFDSKISEIIARNNNSGAILINNSFKPGIYDDNLNLISENYAFDFSNQEKIYWINSCEKGRIVNPEIELIKIQTKQKVCTGKGILNPEVLDLIKLIKSKLAITNVQ